jgi:hypothetical protein
MSRFALRIATAVAAGLLAWSPATASPESDAARIGDFELNGSLANAVTGNGVTLTNNGAALSQYGLLFGAGQGPSLLGLGSQHAYTIDLVFELSNTSSWRKLFDITGLGSAVGLFALNGQLMFYGVAAGTNPPILPNTMTRLTLTRDAAMNFTAYVNDTPALSFYDWPDYGGLSGDVTFFDADHRDAGWESGGFVDYIRVYNNAFSPAQLDAPEPASWAMLTGGFALLGMTLRRRRRVLPGLA